MTDDTPIHPLEDELSRPLLLVVACALAMSVGIAPLYFTTFSIFLLPISEEFEWTRGQMSVLFATTALLVAVASPIVGALMKRMGARRVLIIGIITFSLSILAVSRAPNSFPVFLCLTGLLGLTGAATNTFVYISILPQWFSQRLGLMLGIAMTGIGLGQTVTPILAQALISGLGWRNAYVALAALPLLVALPCVIFLIKERFPATRSEEKAAAGATSAGTYDFLKTRSFWMLGFSLLVIAVSASGAGLHTVPVLIDRGLTPMEAASIAATGGISVFIGRLGAGVLLDYLGVRTVGAGIFLAAAIGPLLLTDYAPAFFLFLVPVLLGLALGAEGDVLPYSIRKKFGLENYSVIYGWMFLMYNIGILLGPLMMGAYYDRTSSYDGMLLAISALVIISYPVFWLAIGKSGSSSQ